MWNRRAMSGWKSLEKPFGLYWKKSPNSNFALVMWASRTLLGVIQISFKGFYCISKVHTFRDNMNSQCARGCYFFLEELLSHMELRAQNDNLRCGAVCGSLFYFHKRGSSNLLRLSIAPCIPVAATSSDYPNQKMVMASDHFHLLNLPLLYLCNAIFSNKFIFIYW